MLDNCEASIDQLEIHHQGILLLHLAHKKDKRILFSPCTHMAPDKLTSVNRFECLKEKVHAQPAM